MYVREEIDVFNHARNCYFYYVEEVCHERTDRMTQFGFLNPSTAKILKF